MVIDQVTEHGNAVQMQDIDKALQLIRTGRQLSRRERGLAVSGA